jgi:FkbM family methyltransferase
VWTSANRFLKERHPSAHKGLKRVASHWLRPDVNFCLPKKVGAHLIWTRPWLLTAAAPEGHVIRWISRTLFQGGTFFDVGAHYGWMSITAAHQVGKHGRVIAFEPSPILLELLSFHTRVNRLPQVQIVHTAVSDHEDAAVPFFLINKGLSFRNSLTIGREDTPYITPEEKLRIEVPCTTLDIFVSESGVIPDLVKIDVEGAELLVLEGARRTLKAHHPTLIIGVHPYWLPSGHSVDQLFSILSDFEYRIEDEQIVAFENSYLADYLCR